LQAARLADVEVARILCSCKLLKVHRSLEATKDVDGTKEDTERGAPRQRFLENNDATSEGNIEMRPKLDSFSAEQIIAGLQSLFQHVSNADVLPRYEKLMMPRLRADVTKRVAAGLEEAYRAVYTAAVDPASSLSVSEGILKGPSQVAALLGI
jgi:hypothetical protein